MTDKEYRKKRREVIAHRAWEKSNDPNFRELMDKMSRI